MKILTVSLLLCATMALTRATGWQVRRCPHHWTQLNHRCFLYVPKCITWHQAEKHCVSLGGHLASIHSHHEAKAVQNMIKRITHKYPTTWLGGTDAKREGVWLWSDGQRFNYQCWSSGNPDNKWRNEDCLVMNYRGRGLHWIWWLFHRGQRRWDDQSCSTKRPFLCAKSLC
ncbi:galactose-specific lectin nattectin-like isoform X1 [Centroberyx gerrardi]